MTIYQLFSDKRPGLTSTTGLEIKFDASMSEQHMVDTEWASRPIESGARLTDHRIKVQRQLQLTVLVSSASVSGLSPFQPIADLIEPVAARHVTVWNRIVSLVHADTPFLWEVVTQLETLELCVIKSASAPRTAADGNTITATLTILQLEFADVDEVTNLADAAQDLALAEVDLGSQGLG